MIEGLLGQQILQADNQRKNRVFSLDYTTSSTFISAKKMDYEAISGYNKSLEIHF